MNDEADRKVRRTLHLRFTATGADPDQLLAMMRAAAPFYQMFGNATFRLLHNADDPAKFIQVIEYETPKSLEANRQTVASDMRLQRSSRPGAPCCRARWRSTSIRRWDPTSRSVVRVGEGHTDRLALRLSRMSLPNRSNRPSECAAVRHRCDRGGRITHKRARIRQSARKDYRDFRWLYGPSRLTHLASCSKEVGPTGALDYRP